MYQKSEGRLLKKLLRDYSLIKGIKTSDQNNNSIQMVTNLEFLISSTSNYAS